MAETNFSSSEQQVNEKFNNAERHIPPPQHQPENLVQLQTFPVPLATIPSVVSGTSPIPAIPVIQPVASIIPTPDGYFASATFVPPQVQQQQPPPQQQTPAQPPRINDIVNLTQNANFFFLQDEEIEPEVSAPQSPPVVSHAPLAVASTMPITNAHIPTQTFTNQTFAAPPHMPQVMSHNF